jgi:hypothetical protein
MTHHRGCKRDHAAGDTAAEEIAARIKNRIGHDLEASMPVNFERHRLIGGTVVIK